MPQENLGSKLGTSPNEVASDSEENWISLPGHMSFCKISYTAMYSKPKSTVVADEPLCVVS